MNKKVALLVLLLAVTAMVCRSEDDDDEQDASWTDWAKDKLSGAFNNDHLKATTQDSANKAKDAALGSTDYVSEKAIEAEDEAADAAKKLSEKASD